MSVINPKLSEDNEISFPFGFKINLIRVFGDKRESKVNLIQSPEGSLFYGIFDEEDTDFKIFLDNRANDPNIGFDLKMVNTPNHSCVITGGKTTILEALSARGKHLHFLSQTTSEGKFLVGMTAKRIKMSIKDAAVECSRIRFTLEVEEKTISQMIGVFVKFMGKTIHLYVDLDQEVGEIKSLICNIEGIPPEEQHFIYCGPQLEDYKTLSDYQIDQQFVKYEDLIASEEYDIKPFIIEMRLKSKYSLE